MLKRVFSKYLGAFACLAALGGVGAREVHATELKLQLYQGPEHSITKIVKAMSPQVEKQTSGRVKINVFDSGTLVKGPQMLDAVEKRIVDIASPTYAFASPKNQPFMMFGSFPFIFRDSSGYIDAFTKEDTLEKLATDYLAEVGYKNVLVTGTYYVGFYQMGFKNKEPKVPSDLKGLKVRSLGAIQPFFDRYGITSVNVNTPEVYDSLERGIIDGAIGVYSNWVDWGWGEPATYLVDVNLAAVGLYFAVSKASLAALRPDDRAVVENFLKSLQEALNAEYVKSDQTYKSTITAKQLMKIYSPNAQETKVWFESRDEVVQKWVKDVGPRAAQALKVIEKYNAPK